MTRNPFDEIERMFDRMSQQFDPLEEGLLEGSVPVDVEDTGEAFVVTADLPGFDREDIDVQLAGETLTVSADHTDEREEGGRYIRRERTQQSVSRSVRLPDPVAEDGTEATYADGVLTVRLPKVGADDGHDIPIN
jgi:HSP20 family protein